MRIENIDTGYSESRMIDILVYHTHNSNSFRMLFFLPLIPNKHGKKFANCKIKITHKGFGKIANELFENKIIVVQNSATSATVQFFMLYLSSFNSCFIYLTSLK